MRVKVVSLDLDGTLVSRDYVDYFWLELVPRLYAERWGLPLSEAKRRVLEQYDEVGPKDLRWYKPRYWFERFGLDSNLLLHALQEAAQLVKPYSDALELLRWASGRFRIVVCTSASREFVNIVFERVPELREHVSRVFSSVSDYALPGKPPEFYLKVLDELKIEPGELLHVGDDDEADCRVPRSLGIRAYVVDRSGERGLRSLLDLLPLLETDQP
ncbi:MAG: HAD family hydrolase [Thermofilaceae archaeon]